MSGLTPTDGLVASHADINKWRSGSGVPSDSLGANDDYYFNSANGDCYWKRNNTWGSVYMSMRGTDGVGFGSSANVTSYKDTATAGAGASVVARSLPTTDSSVYSVVVYATGKNAGYTLGFHGRMTCGFMRTPGSVLLRLGTPELITQITNTGMLLDVVANAGSKTIDVTVKGALVGSSTWDVWTLVRSA